jgi:hypothetical protein
MAERILIDVRLDSRDAHGHSLTHASPAAPTTAPTTWTFAT